MKKLILFLVLSTAAHAGYLYSYKVTVDHTQAGAADSTANFPVLVNIVGNNDFKTTGNGGFILHTVTLNGTSVPADLLVGTTVNCSSLVTAWEIAGYSATAGNVQIWVNNGILSHTVDMVFYICINGPDTTYQSTAANTWNSGFLAVQHAEDVANLFDSKGTISAGTNHSSTNTTSGEIGGASAYVTASSQYQDYGTTTTLDPAAITFSAWVNGTTFPNSYTSVVAREKSSPPNAGNYTLLVKSSGKLAVYVTDSADVDAHYDGTGSNTLSAGTWYLVGFTYVASGSLIGYVNNGVDATVSATSLGLNGGLTNTFYISNSVFGGRFWNGSIDEWRLSNTARNGDWFTAEYNMEKPSQTMVTLGSRVALVAGFPIVADDSKGTPTRGLHE